MSVADRGDTVKVHYTGRIKGGEIFDTSYEDVAKKAGVYQKGREYKPISFIIGAGKVIRGFEEALIGMKEGEEKEFEVPPEKGYGFGTHPLAGKTLIFKVKLIDVFKTSDDVRVPM